MDEELEGMLDEADLDTGLPEAPLLAAASETIPPPDPQDELEMPAAEEKLGHMCIVLSPQVRRQLMRGEPLIVGTSTASVEAFFHRLISVCQMGAHMPVMFQTLGGAVTVANIKKRKHGIISQPSADRYPIPRMGTIGPLPKKSKNTKSAEIDSTIPTTSTADEVAPEADAAAAGAPEADNAAAADKSKPISERDEIPLEAIRLYLKDQRYYPGWNPNAKRNLRKRCKDFELDPTDGTLLYKTRKGLRLECVEDPAQRINLIWEAHVVDHKRRDGLLNVLKEKYYWKGMFQDINKVLDSCEVCAVAREIKGRKDLEQQLDLARLKAAAAHGNGAIDDMQPFSLEKYPETSEVHLLGAFLPDSFQ